MQKHFFTVFLLCITTGYGQDEGERIVFTSANPFSFYHVITDLDRQIPQEVYGVLRCPEGVEPKNLPVAVKAITEQLSKLKEPISEPELSKAKELSKGRLLLRMEDTRSVTGWMGGQEALTGEILSVDQVVANIEAITTDQLNELARELLVSDGLRLAAVGPVTGEDALDALLKL